ncbi:MAG: multiheme c-type cytochrome ExtKL [Pseudomonadota bacterium]
MSSNPRRAFVPALTLVFLALTLALTLAWSMAPAQEPAQGQTPAAPRTLAELAQRYDSSGCRECHQEVHDQWQSSHHARPLMGLDDWIFLRPYLRGSGPLALKDPAQATAAKNFPCAKCHLPQLMNAPDAVAVDLAKAVLAEDKASVGRLGIGCLVCHGDKAVVHGRPQPGVLYGSRDIPDHPGRPVKKSAFLKSALFCGQCHGLGPVLEFETPIQCATLYGSYLHAYLPSGGSQTCQDCHMPANSHYMPPNFNNREETAARLRQALPLQVQAHAYRFQPQDKDYRPLAVVKTRIVSQAGHRIPDG